MSLSALQWAWAQQLPSTGKLVLLALADCARSHQGRPPVCWPSVKLLSQKTGLAQRTIYDALKGLERRGLIHRQPGKRSRTTLYQLKVDPGSPAGAAPAIPAAREEGAVIAAEAAQKMAHGHQDPDPSAEGPLLAGDAQVPHLEEAAEPRARATEAAPRARQGKRQPGALSAEQQARFDRFWAVYPRRVAKAEARKAWAQIDPDEALTERICSAVRAASRSPQWQRQHGRYIPHPATWLRREGWEDEQQPDLPASASTPSDADERVEGTVAAVRDLFGQREEGVKDGAADLRRGHGLLGRGVQQGDHPGAGGRVLGSAPRSRGRGVHGSGQDDSQS